MKATIEHPYPGTFEEFLDWFPTEEDCLSYLEWIRWGKGFICPVCEGRKAWRLQRQRLWECQSCGRQSSVLAGTVFEDTRKPLRLWFHVIWLMMAQKTGMSARNFFETFGFGSYQTSWGWLQKLRSVMVRPGREPLEGRIEVDETYIGGQKEGKRGRGAAGKTLVLVAVEAEEGKRLAEQLMSSDNVDLSDGTAVRFQKALLTLSRQQRTVFSLRYYEDLSYEEISQVTGSSVGTLKVAYHNAKEKIKEAILK